MVWNLKSKIGLWVTIVFLIVVYPNQAFSAQQPLQARLPGYILGGQAELEDGAVLKVHLPEDLGEEGYRYAREVLQTACAAYRQVVFKQGFNRVDYTFASASRLFAYDNDKTIDIYIADVDAPYTLLQPQGGLEYRAKIFIPADREEYQKRYNITHLQLELKASLIHELFHVISYSYNRNMQTAFQGKASLTSKNWDWYNEGLARYFETLVGYRDEFLSSGFRKKCGKAVMVYKGGVNYFLKYPDKPLDERKYDFALFWQYVHQNYGMGKIEEIASKLRDIDPELCSNQEAMQIVARTLGIPLKNLVRNFSLYVYKVSSLPDEREDALEPVAISKLSYGKDEVYNICSFGYGFYEIDLKENLKDIHLEAFNGQKDLTCMLGIRSPFSPSSMPLEFDASGRIKIEARDFPRNSKLIIMLSNPANETIFYQISLN